MLTSIKKILPAKVRHLGLEKAMEFGKLQKGWDAILSVTISPVWQKKSQPVKIKNKVLFVDCLNSVWANEFQMKEEVILEKLKKKFKGLAIEKIRFSS